ncbi:MAG: 4-hydroxy-tetrahydrodipicolinate synthase [Coriobacteriales bacterium]|jgi:4-hydroxy-tetrahydrodipicolinate synthase|nr:4-hydroxy-tetrahydrodipicolinate synthase [Coriobacteriales bacterium]
MTKEYQFPVASIASTPIDDAASSPDTNTTCSFGRFIPAMITPFDTTLDLDLNRAQQLALRLIEGGADALVVNGTTGESPTVFYPQKRELFKAVLAAVDNRVPIIANVGDNCTADSVAFAREVAHLGVNGLMCVVPYYNKPPQQGIYLHFKAIAEQVELPIILYNIPGRCVVNMEAQTTLRLAHDMPNIVAVKEASGDLEQVSAIIRDAPRGFKVYSGDDEETLSLMKAGGWGVISTIGNVAPAPMKALVEAAAQGEWTKARELHQRLVPLMRELFVTANPIMVKEALRLAGFDCGGVRLPLVDATSAQSARLREVMLTVGIP